MTTDITAPDAAAQPPEPPMPALHVARRVDVPPPVPEEPQAKPQSTAPLVLVQRGLLLFTASVVAFVLFVGVFSGLEHGRSQTGLERRLRSELADAQTPIGGDIAHGTPMARLQIPSIGVHEVVVEGTESSTLRKAPGLLPAAPLPGQPGHAVIVGRRLAYGGPFRRLHSLQRGDRITVTTGQGVARYVVERVHVYGASDGRFLTGGSPAMLDLVTSDPVLFPSRRLVAVARLVSKPFAATEHPTKFGSNDLGLDGDTTGANALAIWLEAMLLVVVVSVFVLRRWPLATAYPVVVAVLIVVTWIVFDAAAVLFPATL